MTWPVLDQRRDAERPKGGRKVRRFTRFVDYGLMFDSRRSFSLEYDLLVHRKKIPKIVAVPTSRSASVFYPLAL